MNHVRQREMNALLRVSAADRAPEVLHGGVYGVVAAAELDEYWADGAHGHVGKGFREGDWLAEASDGADVHGGFLAVRKGWFFEHVGLDGSDVLKSLPFA